MNSLEVMLWLKAQTSGFDFDLCHGGSLLCHTMDVPDLGQVNAGPPRLALFMQGDGLTLMSPDATHHRSLEPAWQWFLRLCLTRAHLEREEIWARPDTAIERTITEVTLSPVWPHNVQRSPRVHDFNHIDLGGPHPSLSLIHI